MKTLLLQSNCVDPNFKEPNNVCLVEMTKADIRNIHELSKVVKDADAVTISCYSKNHLWAKMPTNYVAETGLLLAMEDMNTQDVIDYIKSQSKPAALEGYLVVSGNWFRYEKPSFSKDGCHTDNTPWIALEELNSDGIYISA